MNMQWFLLKSPNLSLNVRDDLKKRGVKYFLPTQTCRQRIGGKEHTIERPIAFNYLFIYWTLANIQQYLTNTTKWNLHLVYSRRGLDGTPGHPITVPEAQMEMFCRTVDLYKNVSVPYYAPQQVDLQEGDLVRIVGGAFDGIEGRLVSQQGKKGGKVLVNVSNVLCVPTLHIEPECLQIIEFGKEKKHFYKQMEAYEKRLRAVRAGDEKLLCVEAFVQRFTCLRTSTVNAEAKLLALLLQSYCLLDNTIKYNEIKEKLELLLPTLKSETTKRYVEHALSVTKNG